MFFCFAQGRAQELKQGAQCPFVGFGRVLIGGGSIGGGCVDQLSQRLSFDGRVFRNELCEGISVVNERIAPLFEVVKKVARGSRLAVDVGQLGFDGVGVDLTHQFADKLHLPPASLAAVDCSVSFDGLSQGIGQIDTSPNVGLELGEAQADFL